MVGWLYHVTVQFNFLLCTIDMTDLHILYLTTTDQAEHKYTDGMIDTDSPTTIVDSVGMVLFAVYHGIIIIVLVNMLIAMMSHSFESIQVKFCMNF